jgi:hypothetical protein
MEDYSIVKKNKVVEERGRFYSSSLGYFQVIPEPIFNIIFSCFKDNKKFIKNVRSTCTVFYKVCANFWNQVIPEVYFNSYITKIQSNSLLTPLHIIYKVNVDIEVTKKINSIDIQNCLINSFKFERNFINGVYWKFCANEDYIEHTLYITDLKLPASLKTLDMESIILDISETFEFPTSLINLNLRNTGDITNLINKFPTTLKKLNISLCDLKGNQLKDLPKNLSSLSIDSCIFVLLPSELSQISSNITYLSLKGFPADMNDEIIKVLPKKLITLKLCDCTCITDEGFSYLPSTLQNLYITRSDISDKGVSLLPKGLKILEFISCNNITENFTLPFVDLKILHIMYCENFKNNVSIEKLKKKCPKIRFI